MWETINEQINEIKRDHHHRLEKWKRVTFKWHQGDMNVKDKQWKKKQQQHINIQAEPADSAPITNYKPPHLPQCIYATWVCTLSSAVCLHVNKQAVAVEEEEVVGGGVAATLKALDLDCLFVYDLG